MLRPYTTLNLGALAHCTLQINHFWFILAAVEENYDV